MESKHKTDRHRNQKLLKQSLQPCQHYDLQLHFLDYPESKIQGILNTSLEYLWLLVLK